MQVYDDDKQARFCELAQQVGIGRAKAELGYPSYPTALKWMNARGITPAVDTLMAEVKRFHTFYETTDALVVVEAGLARVREKFQDESLDADELKKTSEAAQKLLNTWLVLQGKATSVTESRAVDPMTAELQSLAAQVEARANTGVIKT